MNGDNEIDYTSSQNGVIPPLTPRFPNTGLQPANMACVAYQKTIPDNIIDDTTSDSMNTRATFFAPSDANLSDLVLAFPQFGENNPEADFPTNYTVSGAAIEYPAGTFTQVFFGGLPTVTVTAGRNQVKSDPVPIMIPAGATFYVKTFIEWTVGHFWLSTFTAAQIVGDWTARGTGLTDQTQTTTTQTTTSSVGGFSPAVYGRLSKPLPVVGIIGDSISVSVVCRINPVTGYNPLGESFLGKFPVINTAKGGDSMANYVTRNDGRSAMFRDSVTHVLVTMGRNDSGSADQAPTMIANLQKMIDPFLNRGVKCFAVTVTPYTTSTDSWTTTAGQAWSSSGAEYSRRAYNDLLRTNYTTYGLTRVWDWAWAVDPTDSGKWPAGENTGYNGAAYATISGGSVVSVIRAAYNIGGTTGGSNYPPSQSIPCVVLPYPGDPGGGAEVIANVDSTGAISSYTVLNGGTNYGVAPMVAPVGQWTGNDGIHPSQRAWHQMIYRGGFGPDWFTV